MSDMEWVKTHRHLQRIGSAFSDPSSILLDADVQRREGNMEAAAALVGAARSLIRQRVSYGLLVKAKVSRPKRPAKR